jgi:hypothetical protein
MLVRGKTFVRATMIRALFNFSIRTGTAWAFGRRRAKEFAGRAANVFADGTDVVAIVYSLPCCNWNARGPL